MSNFWLLLYVQYQAYLFLWIILQIKEFETISLQQVFDTSGSVYLLGNV